MNVFLMIYILNACLLLLHEIESAYVKEWKLFKLPGGIKGFLLLHVPIILFLFWGVVEIERQAVAGRVIGLVAGVGGTIPFLVHKVLMKRKGYFDSIISNVIIILNAITGVGIAGMALFG